MTTTQALAQAKKSARALSNALKRQGLALSLGQALDVQSQVAGFSDWNAFCAQASTPASKEDRPTRVKRLKGAAPQVEQTSIIDVDFYNAHCVIMGGSCFNIEWREEAVLAYLGKNGAPGYEDYENWEDETALSLHREEDGLVWEELLTLGELDNLYWDGKEQVFKRNSDGETYQFFVSKPFSGSANSGPERTTSKDPAPLAPAVDSLADVRTEARDSYLLFRVALVSGGSEFAAALNTKEAIQVIQARHPKSRLSYTSILEVVAEPYGPFNVEGGGGYFNQYRSLQAAIQAAKDWLAADDEVAEVSVVTQLGTVIITFEA
jgi:hypothetical protein